VKKKTTSEETEFGLVPADHPMFREGWVVGLPLSWPAHREAPRGAPPPADPEGDVSASQRGRVRRRRPR
jgi:hypothetical protein